MRPSTNPFSRTIKSLSNKITSAASLAISTPLSTEIPTSLAFRANASLIPSPIYPTLCPFSFKTLIISAFCSGDNFAKIVVVSTTSFSLSKPIFATSWPNKIFSTFNPTFWQIALVTFSLSPVKIFVATPCSFNAFIAGAVDSFAGSRKAKYPIKTISFSSLTVHFCTKSWSVFWLTPKTRKPFSLSCSTWLIIIFSNFCVNGQTLPRYSTYLQTLSISSIAPFVTICTLPSWSWIITDILRRWKSNGISSIFSYLFVKSFKLESLSCSANVLLIIALSIRLFNPVW